RHYYLISSGTAVGVRYKNSVSGGTGALTYNWTPGNLSDPTITVNPTSTTTYTVLVTDANGCTATDQVIVTVNPLPVITFSGDLEICVGESTTITASGGTQYAWNTGDNTASATVNPAVTTTYTVTVTDANNCTTSADVTVVVNENPTASILGDPVVCQNQTTTLTATGAGAGGSYLWSTTETTASITVSPTDIETYSVTITDANGCTDETSVTVTAAPEPIAVAAAVEICAGESTTLTVSGGVSYQWDANG
ncbi:MAG: hypothetical protein AAFP77_31690, partial [Bacteroidota bacterium]